MGDIDRDKWASLFYVLDFANEQVVKFNKTIADITNKIQLTSIEEIKHNEEYELMENAPQFDINQIKWCIKMGIRLTKREKAYAVLYLGYDLKDLK